MEVGIGERKAGKKIINNPNFKMAVKAALLITNLHVDFHGDCKIRVIVFILAKNVA